MNRALENTYNLLLDNTTDAPITVLLVDQQIGFIVCFTILNEFNAKHIVSTIRNSTPLLQNGKRNAATDPTKLCDSEKTTPHSHLRFEYTLATTKLKHAVFVRPSQRTAYAGTSSPLNRTVFCSFCPLYISNGHSFVIGRT